MLFENLKPIRVLSEDEVKMELYRLRQKQILGVTAIGTGTLATFKLLKYISPIFDPYIYGFRGKSVNTYLKLSNKLNQSISFPYVTSVNVLHITICVSIFLFILYLVAFIKYKKNNTLTIKDVLLTISPILLWVAMEVIF